MSESELWSYSTGQWGESRVRVYERYPGSPIQVEFTGGRPQSLKGLTGKSIRDKKRAERIANKMSERLAREHSESVDELLGVPKRRTVGELLRRYHADMESEWSAKHTKTQRQLRKWWTARLGKDADLRAVNEAMVEDVVRREAKANKWSARTRQKYLRYIMAAFRFARRKLKWIREHDDLTAVDVPKADRGGPSYSRAEMHKLLKAAPEVDWRTDLALNLAYDTASRSKSIINLRTSDYMGGGVLRFPAEYDKMKRYALVPISPTTRWKVEAALRRPEVKESGFLFPEDGKPIRYDRLLELLEDVEVKAKVPKVERRGWHGVKRRAVTDLRAQAAKAGLLPAVSKQTRTSEETMRAIYEQDDMEPKRALAAAMESLRHGA